MSHMSSTFMTKGVANKVGFAMGVPLTVADGAMDCEKFCAAAPAASSRMLALDLTTIVASGQSRSDTRKDERM